VIARKDDEMTMRRFAAPAALALFLSLGLTACSDDDAANTEASTEPQARIQIERLGDVAAPAGGTAAADVKPLNDATLSAELASTVKSVAADVGASVSRGDLLVQLDDADARLALAQANAQVAAADAAFAQAEADKQRAEDLHPKHFISDDALSAARTAHARAKAEVAVRRAARDVAARQLEKTRIAAPFDAVVVQRTAQVGATVVPGTPLLRVIDRSTPDVQARLDPAQARQLADATSVWIDIGADRYPLSLTDLAAVVDPASRTRVARLSFDGNVPAPGSNGELHWRAAGFEIPADLLVQRDGRLGIFVAEDGKAQWREVPGAQAGRPAQADLPGDLMVITVGQQSLQDGQALPSAKAVAEAD